ncbi:MAG: DMT family transporter [Rhodospirillales bacterium]
MTAFGHGARRFAALPGATRGALWMVLASVAFGGGFVVIRLLTEHYSVYEVAFFRSILGTLFLLPWAVRAGRQALRTRRYGAYALYIAAMYGGVLLWFYGLANLPTAEATALYFTTPLFSIIGAAVALGERVGPRRWAATAIGLLGAVVIIRPGVVEITTPVFAVMGTAVLFGIANAAVKALTRTEPPNAVVLHGLWVMSAVGLPPALDGWITPVLAHAPLILLLGLSGFIGQLCFTRSVQAAPMSVAMPPFFLQLPFAALFAYLAYAEVPGVYVWIGATIICGSTYYNVLQEARAARAGRA